MDQTHDLLHPDLPYSAELPAEWKVDIGGLPDGLVIAADSYPWSMEFHPNVTMTHARLGLEHDSSVEATLSAQRSVEPALAESLADYRLLHLDYESFGSAPETGAEVPGVMRAAYYTNPDGVPLMMHQWVARHAGHEVSMTVTFAAADLPEWAGGSWSLAALLMWKDG